MAPPSLFLTSEKRARADGPCSVTRHTWNPYFTSPNVNRSLDPPQWRSTGGIVPRSPRCEQTSIVSRISSNNLGRTNDAYSVNFSLSGLKRFRVTRIDTFISQYLFLYRIKKEDLSNIKYRYRVLTFPVYLLTNRDNLNKLEKSNSSSLDQLISFHAYKTLKMIFLSTARLI